VIDALSSHLVERFLKVLDDPVLEAFSIFDVRKWPADKGVLKESYIDGMRLLYKTYKIFYAEEETEEMVLEQWEDLKAEINVPRQATFPERGVRVEARGEGWQALPHLPALHRLLLPEGLPALRHRGAR